MVRNTRWHWIILDMSLPQAYVMDDFGNLVPISYRAARISMRAGDA